MAKAYGRASSASLFQAAALAAVMVAAGLPLAAMVSDAPDNVLLVLQPELYVEIFPELERFSSELEADGYSATVAMGPWPDAAALRERIAQAWRDHGLAGCIILGDVPVATYEIWGDSTIGGGRSVFPIDLYFEDLDGEWLDTDSDGALDWHEDGLGDGGHGHGDGDRRQSPRGQARKGLTSRGSDGDRRRCRRPGD